MVLSNTILEYSGLGEFYEDPSTTKEIIGTSTGAFAIGDTVTQDTSGATGTVSPYATANGGTGLYLCLVTGTFAATGNPHIHKDSNPAVYFTPTGVFTKNHVGPKIIGCKIQDNTDGNAVYLGANVYGAIITANELQASTSGHFAIYLDGSDRNIIQGNRFLAHHASASGHIALGSAGSSGNIIQGNHFVLTSDTVPAIVFETSSLSNLITGNVFSQNYASPVVNPIVRYNGLEQNIVNDNLFYNNNGYDISYQYQSVQWTSQAETTAPAWKAAYNNTNAGWTTGEELTLPSAKVGMERQFYVQANKYLRVGPDSTDTISITVGGGAQQAAGKYIQSTTIGDFIFLKCVIANQWECMAVKGTWEVEG